MNRVILILFFSFCSTLNISAQEKNELEKHLQPIIEGRTGPLLLDTVKPIFIINNVIIRDSLKIERFRKKYTSAIEEFKYFERKQALKNYGILHEDGIIVIRTRKKKIIDLN